MDTADIAGFLSENFDFVIVGGGTAGLVLAVRLSEDPNIRVGVLEAGLSRLGDPKVELPGGPGLLLNNPEYDWVFKSVPQKAAGDKVFHLPRGKMLGGSSGINFMGYGRPCAEDLNAWSAELGLKGWSWDDLLPYFKKSQKLEADLPNIKLRNRDESPLIEELHGTEGPIHTSMGVWHWPFEASLMPALDSVSGIPRPEDPCGGSHLGFFRSLFATDRTGTPKRSYAGNHYLESSNGRPNLRVLTAAVASKLVLERDGESLAATRVEFSHGGTRHTVKAKKEVILSAGSFHSPQLLELSGIGDANILSKAGIDCVLENRNVGSNMQDHCISAVIYEMTPDAISLDSLSRDGAFMKQQQQLYAESGTGALSGSVSLLGYISYRPQVSEKAFQDTIGKITSQAGHDPAGDEVFQRTQRKAIARRMQTKGSADLQVLASPGSFDVTRGQMDCSKTMGGAREGYNPCYSLTLSSMYPLSRGSVHVASSSHSDMPLVDPAYSSHAADVDVLAAGLEFADRVFRSDELKGKVGRRVAPPPSVDLEDDEQGRNYARDHIITYHHGLGTCALGQVVDERLRVKGLGNVRVVDASVMPMQVSAAILATVYAIAEKAADLVKEDWNLES